MRRRHWITEYSRTMATLADGHGVLVAILHGPAAYANARALADLLDNPHRVARRGTCVGIDVCL